MDNMALNRLRFETDLSGGFANAKAKGTMPNPWPSPFLLNLGCGRDVRDDFVNIDLFSDDARVVYGDIRKLDLPDNCADFIIASDVLEHFSHRETSLLLKEWARVLKPGSELVVRCPSLKLQAQAYLDGVWNADIASYMIFGGQTNPGDYHCVGFDEITIKEKLQEAGLEVVLFEELKAPQDQGFINLNMVARARKPVNIFSGGLDFSFIGDDPSSIEALTTNYAPDPVTSGEDYNLELLADVINHVEKAKEGLTPIFSYDDLFDITKEVQDPALFETKQEPSLNIVWEGSQFVYHSLALVNREHCSNILSAGGSNLTIIPYERDEFSPDISPKYKKLLENDIRYKEEVSDEVASLPYVWIRHQWPPKAEAPQGAKWIIMQPWEFSSLRKDFVDTFKQAEEIWTPSSYSRRCIVESGVPHEKVQIIPNGIDPEVFKPEGDIFPIASSKRIKFLFVGGTIFRKGFDILLEAYVKTFTNMDDVCLVIKDMGGDSFYRGQTAKDNIAKIKSDPNSPEIIYIDKSITENEMANLYRACDVFVSPYRGEGFSLPALEAMASGLPIIVTKGGATDDFADVDCAWFIPAEKRSIGDVIDGHPLAGEAFLLEPNQAELCKLLKFISVNPTQVFSAGLIGSYKARKYWTWKKSTKKALSRLDCFFGTNLGKQAQVRLKETDDEYILIGSAEKAYIEGDFERSKERFEQALHSGEFADRFQCHILNRLSQLAIGEGEMESAEKYHGASAHICYTNPDTRYLGALIKASQGANDETFEELTPIFETWTINKHKGTLGVSLDDILVFAGDVLIDEGDLESANQYYESALKVNPENDAACFGAGRAFFEAGVDEPARTMLEWALKLNPTNEEAQYLLDELDKSN